MHFPNYTGVCVVRTHLRRTAASFNGLGEPAFSWSAHAQIGIVRIRRSPA